MRMSLNLFVILFLLFTSAAASEVRVFTLSHQSAEELVPVIEQSLDEKAKVTAFRNQLIVRGSTADLKAVEALIKQLDRQRASLRISVRQEQSSVGTSAHLGAGATAKAGDVVFEVGEGAKDKDQALGLKVRGQRTLGNTQSSVEQFLHVLDGDRALILVGKRIPFTSDLAAVTGKHSAYVRSVRYQEVDTGFWVKPSLRGEEVEMEISPRLADASAGDPPVIEFQELTTRVRVPLGAWFDLGATMSGRDEVTDAIFSHSLQAGTEQRRVLIKVDR